MRARDRPLLPPHAVPCGCGGWNLTFPLAATGDYLKGGLCCPASIASLPAAPELCNRPGRAPGPPLAALREAPATAKWEEAYDGDQPASAGDPFVQCRGPGLHARPPTGEEQDAKGDPRLRRRSDDAAPRSVPIRVPGCPQVVVGDVSGTVHCFSVKKMALDTSFKSLPTNAPVTNISLVTGRSGRGAATLRRVCIRASKVAMPCSALCRALARSRTRRYSSRRAGRSAGLPRRARSSSASGFPSEPRRLCRQLP